jgi:hypothetical protein
VALGYATTTLKYLSPISPGRTLRFIFTTSSAAATAPTQPRHLGGDGRLIDEHQPPRLQAHARLTLVDPFTTSFTNLGACALRGHQSFFIGKPGRT